MYLSQRETPTAGVVESIVLFFEGATETKEKVCITSTEKRETVLKRLMEWVAEKVGCTIWILIGHRAGLTRKPLSTPRSSA